jgi:hypothetical protein
MTLLRRVHKQAIRATVPILLLFSILHFTTPVGAATFRVSNIARGGYHLVIYDEIARGDYERLTAIIRQRNEFPHSVSLMSPGGDAVEAMRIGRLFRRALLFVRPTSWGCASACALIALAAARIEREPGSLGYEKVLLHRAKFSDDYFSRLSFEEAKRKQAELDQHVRAYLLEMNVPQNIIDLMMMTPSNDVRSIDWQEYTHSIDYAAPAVHEWLRAKCGSIPKDEEADINAVIASNHYKYELSSYEYAREQGSDPKNRNALWQAGITNSQARLRKLEPDAKRASGLSQGYVEYLAAKMKKREDCIGAAVATEQSRLLRTLPELRQQSGK